MCALNQFDKEAARVRYVNFLLDQVCKPCLWGGNGPDGYDCSGLVVAGLQYAGVNITDHTAAQLATIFEHKKTDVVKPGCLIFYGDEDGIFHIMSVASVWQGGHYMLIGACGGDSKTKTVQDAARQRAAVETKHAGYWASAQMLIVDPFA